MISPIKMERRLNEHGWDVVVTMTNGFVTTFGRSMTEAGSKRMLTIRAKQFGLKVKGTIAE